MAITPFEAMSLVQVSRNKISKMWKGKQTVVEGDDEREQHRVDIPDAVVDRSEKMCKVCCGLGRVHSRALRVGNIGITTSVGRLR